MFEDKKLPYDINDLIGNSVPEALGTPDFTSENTPTFSNGFTDGIAPEDLSAGELHGNVSMTDGYLQSKNFVTGSAGWQLLPNGNLEASNGNFRGDVTGATGTFSGTIAGGSLDIGGDDTTSAHIDSTGNYWAGASVANKATAPARISNAGVATFTGAVIDGTSTIAGITGTQIGYVATSTADAVPTGLTCSSTTANVASDGSVSSQVVLTWTAISTNTFDHYLIRYKKAANTYYTYIPSTINTITIEGLTPAVSYNFGIASVNKYGAVSAYSSDISQTTATSTTAPATVVVGSATAGIQYVIVEWTHSASTDLASYNIYRKTTDDSSTSTLIGNCRTNYFVDGGRTGGQIYYYWVKAVNTSGLLSASYSTTVSATPRDVTSADIVELAGTKVLIDGAVYLSNWRHGTDLTKIDGGDIYTGSVTTTQLNFTPVQSTDVIAKINASAEGITIDADNLTINSATTFAAGYNPTSKVTTFAQDAIPTSVVAGDIWIDTNDDNKTYRAASAGADEIKAGEWILLETTKVKTFAQDAIPTSLNAGDIWVDTNDGNKMYRATNAGDDEVKAGEWVAVQDANKLNAVGGAYDTASSGARVRIFPDANTGIQVIDDSAADVFKAEVGGTNVGDVTIGNYAGGVGVKWDKSAGAFYVKGDISGSTGTFTGTVTVGSIDIGGDDATSAHIDTDGNLWLGASVANKATAPARISNAGAAHFENVEIGGSTVQYVISNSGIFSFGDGSDGDATCDGSTAVAGMSRSGDVYTLTRDVYFDDLTVGVNSEITIDSYSETNRSDDFKLRADNYTYEGQSFTNVNTVILNSCKFYLSKTGTPTGNAYAKIYAHSGTYGTNGIPTGSALATSDSFDVSTLTTSPQLITFNFSGANKIVLNASTKYILVLNYSGTSNSSNYVKVGYDGSSPTATGNECSSTNGSTWEYGIVSDLCFYIYASSAPQSIKPAGYRIFVQGTLTINGAINGNGDAGNNGASGPNPDNSSVGVNGGAAVSMADGYLKGSATTGVGGHGGAGDHGDGGLDGGAGGNGTNTTNSLGSNAGGTAGAGGTGGIIIANPSHGHGGAAGTSGTATVTNVALIANWHLATLLDISSTGSTVKFNNSGSAPGGGGGAGGTASSGYGGTGGSGGAGGCSGRIVAIYARSIIISATGSITANGGAGGDGGNGATASSVQWTGGGGGGGGGGNGGIIIYVYNTLSNAGSLTASAGAKGNKGLKGVNNGGTETYTTDGYDGTAGSAGTIYAFQLSL